METKNLVIVESPNKVKKIQSFLNKKEYVVTSTVGHIRDLKKSGEYRMGIDLQTMEPSYSILTNKKETIKNLKTLAKNSNVIYLATDPDREGESIAWHVTEVLNSGNNKNQNFKRITFNEISKNAVLKAIENSRDINDKLVESQETRRMLDRMIGFRLSKLTKQKLSAKSAGRVKSAALKMIIDRENEIKKFVIEKWFTIEGEFVNDLILINVDEKNNEIKYKDEATAIDFLSTLKGKDYIFLTQKVSSSTVSKPKPLDMASYLIGMYSKYKISNARATMAAQKLYEKGIISYPRTDSKRISSQEFLKEIEEFAQKNYPSNSFEAPKLTKSKANTQDAHEAIRPVHISALPNDLKLKGDEEKSYKFIWSITMKTFLDNGKNKIYKNIYKVNDSLFMAKESTIDYLGFRIVDGNEVLEPNLKKEDIKSKSIDVNIKEHETKPPARFNQGSLIKKMKEEGIGRPSTYSSVISGLLKYLYIQSESGSLVPTEMGNDVNKLLIELFPDIVNEKTTARFEEILDEIVQDQKSGKEFLQEFWSDFDDKVDFAEKTVEVKLPTYVNRECPECGGQLVEKFSRFGKFIGCENYPKCKYHEYPKKHEPEKYEEKCPECGSDLLIRRARRTGAKFIGCSNYPKCKYTAKLPENYDSKTNLNE